MTGPSLGQRIQSFTDGLHGKQYAGAILIDLYYDDYEPCNPIGTARSAYKLGALLMRVRNVGLLHNSSPASCHLIMLGYEGDFKASGFSNAFSVVANELRELTQIGVEIDSETIPVRLCQILGDTKGIHELFGLLSGKANYFCRECRITREVAQHEFVHSNCEPRTVANSVSDLHARSCGQESHGVKENCCFNSIPGWHFTENYNFDTMHDCNEGFAMYEIKTLLRFYVEQKRLSVESLNHAISKFDWPKKSSAPSPNFTYQGLKDKSKKLVQKARQMYYLAVYLPFLIAKRVNVNDEYYRLLILLITVIDILHAPDCDFAKTFFLDALIEEKLDLFRQLFPSCSITNKQHHSIHYGHCIRMTGPLSHASCFHFEAKHQEAKQYASLCRNHTNLPHSIAWKHQLIQFRNFVSGRLIRESLYSKVHEKSSALNLGETLQRVLYQALAISLTEEIVISWEFVRDGHIYSKGKCVVPLELDEANSESVYGIFEFALLEATKKFIVVRETESYFSWHLQAFLLTALGNYRVLPLSAAGRPSAIIRSDFGDSFRR
ncbi:MAG: hypothetical protein V2I33_17115 [Kangiellaceae bacterium]|nr:hypothetical protein [Kangiellaceae bacterium]